jgi:uncharacterized membrane protein (Fun14 family)
MAAAAAAAAAPVADNKAATTATTAKSAEDEKKIAAADAAAQEALMLVVKDMSISGVLGFCSAAAFKKWSRDAIVGVGSAFIFLQGMKHLGFIEIHWHVIGKRVGKALDQNGDGKFDGEDVKILAQRGMDFLRNGLPDAAGFTIGFYSGLKLL